MSFITDIKWTGDRTFEEIVIWFCDPMKEFLEMHDEHSEENDVRATFLYYEMKNKVDDLSKLLYRLMHDYRGNPVPEELTLIDEPREKLINEYAEIMGVDEKYLRKEDFEKYSIEQLRLMKAFFKALHKGK